MHPNRIGRQASLHDRMRHLFKTGFTATDIAEPLVSVAAAQSAREAESLLQEWRTEVALVYDRGLPVGYVLQSGLSEGVCADHAQSFRSDCQVPPSASYQEVIETLDRRGLCFVTFLGQVSGVIQKRDMTKPSVRMWLFGLITIAEMTITDRVERLFPDESWQE